MVKYYLVLLINISVYGSDRTVKKYSFDSDQVRHALTVVFPKGDFIESYGEDVVARLVGSSKRSQDIVYEISNIYGEYAIGKGANLKSLSYRVNLMHGVIPDFSESTMFIL